jgi:hypothetical protein
MMLESDVVLAGFHTLATILIENAQRGIEMVNPDARRQHALGDNAAEIDELIGQRVTARQNLRVGAAKSERLARIFHLPFFKAMGILQWLGRCADRTST